MGPTIEGLRVLVIGGTGLLGQDVVTRFRSLNWQVVCPSHNELDITWPQHVEKLRIGDFGQFDWVVNCSAFTQVDLAESNTMAAMQVNGVAPGTLAFVCAQNHWRILHLSTDFAFDGQTSEPYTESSIPSPIGAYGRSKLLGEQNVMGEAPDSVIVRTAWLYGPLGKCFPRTMIEAWLAGKELKVVNDQTGSPTYTADLARVLSDLLALNPPAGIYHAAGPDSMTWYDLALASIQAYRTVNVLEREVKVIPVSTKDWPTAAKRPPYSVLSNAKIQGLGISPMRKTEEALTEFCQRLNLDR